MWETILFKTLNIGQPRIEIPERQKTNAVSTMIASAHYVDIVSRWQPREGEPRQNLVDSLSCKDIARSLRKPRQLEFTEESTKSKKFCQERTLKIIRGPPTLII